MWKCDRCGGVGAGVHDRAEAGLAHALSSATRAPRTAYGRAPGRMPSHRAAREAGTSRVRTGPGLDVVEREADIVLVHLCSWGSPRDEFAGTGSHRPFEVPFVEGVRRHGADPHEQPTARAAPRPREPVAAGTSPPVSAYRCETTRSPMPAQPTTLSAGVAASFRSPVRQPSSSTSVTARRMSSAASFMPKL